MSSIRPTPVVLALVSISLGSNVTNAQDTGAGDDSLAIVQVTENVFRYGDESNVFVVTSEGIIVIDGTCEGGGQEWLKEELGRRYDVPVKYVILSHDHESHICGTQVYSDTAAIIAHERALPHILREGLSGRSEVRILFGAPRISSGPKGHAK